MCSGYCFFDRIISVAFINCIVSSTFKALLRRKVLHVDSDSRARIAFHSFISFLFYVHHLFCQKGFLYVDACDTNLLYTFLVNV